MESIARVRTDYHYDLRVPGYDNFIVDGLVHHNSGKTQLGAQLAVATALGRRDATAQAWCQLNGLDPSMLPDGPGDVWAVALDSGDSIEYVRPAVRAYCPAATTWRNADGHGYAEARLPGGGRIGFKSVDEGRDGFQGTAKHGIWFDEEPRDEGVWNEALARLIDRQGRAWATLTPMLGLTWMYRRYVADTPPEARVHELHSEDNPHIPQTQLGLILRQFGAHEQEARRYGHWTTMEGRVYAFERRLHVVPAHAVPLTWPRVGGIDFGTRNPFCFLLGALDEKDDVLHVVAEHYQREWTLKQHVGAIRALLAEPGMCAAAPGLRWTVADPADAGARKTLDEEERFPTRAASKDVRIGINAVAERLAPDAAGRVHLVVHDRCLNVIREVESYAWDTSSGRGDAKDAPLKRDDHAMDALRYMAMELRSTTLPELQVGWLR